MTESAQLPTFNVCFVAKYEVCVEVEATSPDEAISLVKEGGGKVVNESFQEPHPFTDWTAEVNDGT